MQSWQVVVLAVATDEIDLASAALFELGTSGIQQEGADEAGTLRAYFSPCPPLEALHDALASYGVTAQRLHVESVPDTEVDWSENWKLHFQPQAVGDRFYICPPWAPDAPPGREAIVIHPGMAFGTGQHATTRGCLLLIEASLRDGLPAAAADIGTGSGILAIALAKLGVPRIHAVDTDPVARESTRENADRNGVAAALAIGSSVDDVPETCGLIVANLFADLLDELAGKLVARCAGSGTIVCSGMLESDVGRVAASFASHGWAAHRTFRESPWAAVAFTRDGS